MPGPFFTVGHSDRPIEEFLGLLRAHDVALIVDVRRLPGSAAFPWFDEDALRGALEAEGIGYRRPEALTGRRGVSHDVPFVVNAWWENRSFHNYADHALSAPFGRALDELVQAGRARRAAVMCAEAVWWRCHRRIIADHLLARGEAVRHILGPGRADDAELSAGAVVAADGGVTYPAEAGAAPASDR